MKAASKVTVTTTTATASLGKQNGGDVKRRPSYPGEQRVKHANMSSKIWVKVAMAIAYFFCVSVAAFILVIYYVFFWTPDGTGTTFTGNNVTNSSSAEVTNRTDCAPRLG